MGKGTIEVPGGVESFEVVVAVEAEEALEGNEVEAEDWRWSE